jgi:hypothetical protein
MRCTVEGIMYPGQTVMDLVSDPIKAAQIV